MKRIVSVILVEQQIASLLTILTKKILKSFQLEYFLRSNKRYKTPLKGEKGKGVRREAKQLFLIIQITSLLTINISTIEIQFNYEHAR